MSDILDLKSAIEGVGRTIKQIQEKIFASTQVIECCDNINRLQKHTVKVEFKMANGSGHALKFDTKEQIERIAAFVTDMANEAASREIRKAYEDIHALSDGLPKEDENG
jgi:hypothetical protein